MPKAFTLSQIWNCLYVKNVIYGVNGGHLEFQDGEPQIFAKIPSHIWQFNMFISTFSYTEGYVILYWNELRQPSWNSRWRTYQTGLLMWHHVWYPEYHKRQYIHYVHSSIIHRSRVTGQNIWKRQPFCFLPIWGWRSLIHVRQTGFLKSAP